jgi:hypothetical protein
MSVLSRVGVLVRRNNNVEERPFQGRVTKGVKMGFSPGGRACSW